MNGYGGLTPRHPWSKYQELPVVPTSDSSDDSDDVLEPEEDPESELDELEVLDDDDFSSRDFLVVDLFLAEFDCWIPIITELNSYRLKI